MHAHLPDANPSVSSAAAAAAAAGGAAAMALVATN